MSSSREVKGSASLWSKRMRILLEKVQQQANIMDASGVVGLTIEKQSFNKDLCEWSAIGTAIRRDKISKQKKPVLCTISGQEYMTLVEHGYEPRGLVFGTGIYYQRFHQRFQGRLRQNVERKDITRGYSIAQSQALNRLNEAAISLKADGIIAVSLHADKDELRTDSSDGGFTIAITTIGTAVVTNRECNPRVDFAVLLSD